MRLWLCISLLAVPCALAVACGQADNALLSTGCTDDTECAGNKVCSHGKCVKYTGGSAGTGTGSGGGSSGSGGSTGSGFEPDGKKICEDYLSCLAVVDPQSVATALPTYGSSGTCWQGDQQTADTCATACRQAMKQQHDNSPSDCLECYVDADCAKGTCQQGTCVVPAPPLAGGDGPDCLACRDQSVGSSCASQLESCTSFDECIAFADCAAPCQDFGCLQACDQQVPNGGGTYYGYLTCVVCNDCQAACPIAAMSFCSGF